MPLLIVSPAAEDWLFAFVAPRSARTQRRKGAQAMTNMRYRIAPNDGAPLCPVLSVPTDGPAGSGNEIHVTGFGSRARPRSISGEGEQRNGRRVCATGGDM
jgi:hypothetical protein